MAFLVKQKVRPVQGSRWIERTYEENVTIVDGRGVCEHRSTADTLFQNGYDVVRELPALQDLAEQEPALAVDLARMGLGPWAGKTAGELDAIAQEHA